METIQKKTSEAQTRANKKYSEKEMKMYSVNVRKEVSARLEMAVQKSGVNRNKWITTAILEKLEREGFLQEQERIFYYRIFGVKQESCVFVIRTDKEFCLRVTDSE